MRIVCCGDSNTLGYDPGSYFGGRYSASERWVDVFAKLSGVELVNLGENGRSIPAGPLACDIVLKQLEKYKQDFLVIMLGTNDLLNGSTAEEVCEKMDAFIEKLRPVFADILLLAPPPLQRGAWVGDERIIIESRLYSKYLEKLALSRGLVYMDSAAWGAELAFDGVHLTARGHEVFARSLYEEMKRRKLCLKQE